MSKLLPKYHFLSVTLNALALYVPSLLICIFFLVHPSVGHAQNSCAELFLKRPVGQGSIEFDARAVDIPLSKIRKHFLPEIDRARGLAEESGLIFPNKPIKITIHPNFNFEGPVASIKVRMDILDITVPYQHLFDKRPYPRSQKWRDYSRHPVHSLPSFHHELGHAILKHNLVKNDSPAARFFLLEAHAQELAVEGKNLLKETAHLSRPEMEKVVVPFAEKFEQIDRAYKSLKRQNFGRFLEGLDELFADVVSVLLSKKPNPIDLNTIRRPINNADKFSYRSRDFSNPKNELSVWEGARGDIHNFFSPTRYYLYETYFKYPMYMSGLKRKVLLGSLIRAVEEFSKISKEDFDDMSLHQANQRFIKIFESIMKNSS